MARGVKNNMQEIDLYNHDTKRIEKLINLAQSKNYEVCVWGAGVLGREFGRQMLNDYEIHIDYYCDNNAELIDKEIVDGIYCRKIQRLVENTFNTICFLLMRDGNVKEVYCQLISMGIKNIVTYNDLLSLHETARKYMPFMQKKQIAIYTCITGDYDILQEPNNIIEEADYFLVSDSKPLAKTIYKWIDVNEVVPNDIMDNISKNRYCKMNAHRIFPNYRYSVYFDGNICLRGDIIKCIPNLMKTRIGVFGRKTVDSVYAEALGKMMLGRDFPQIFLKQAEKYWLEGMPEDFGVFFCGVLLREHNNPICKKIMEEWWEEFRNNSKRDQISFSYVLWKNGYSRDDVMLICDTSDPFTECDFTDCTIGHKKERIDVRKT